MIKRYIGILRHPGYNGDIADDVLGFDPNGGGIYDIPIVGDVADVVINSPLGNVVAFAFPPAAPFIYAAKSAQALASGNELGALLNAVGAYTAYASPTATTTANLGGMEISGINANLVQATEMALAGGASVTDVAKTLVGMGNQEAANKVLTDAGVDAQAAADALNTAGQEVMNYTATAADAAQSIKAMQEAGLGSDFIAEQVSNWQSAGIAGADIAKEMANMGAPASFAVKDSVKNITGNLTEATGDSTFQPMPWEKDLVFNPETGMYEYNAAQTYPYSPDVIQGTPLEPLPGMEPPGYFAADEAGSLNVTPQPVADLQYLNGPDVDNYYFNQVAAEASGLPPDYMLTSGLGAGTPGGVVGADGQIGAGGLFDVPPTLSGYTYDGMWEEYPDSLGESFDAGIVPDNAGVPPGGWPDDYGSEWGLGQDIGVGLEELGLGGLANQEMANLQNNVQIPQFGGSGGISTGGGTNISITNPSSGLNNAGLWDLLGGALTAYNAYNTAQNYEDIAKSMDPYWDYRQGGHIPMMQSAANTAGSLQNLYEQSFNDPLAIYNTPQMQALNAQFLEGIKRKDAALGRNSQYGAQQVAAQNQFLTNALPAYQQNLQQGLNTLYGAAKPPDYNQQAAATVLSQGANAYSNMIPAAIMALGGNSGMPNINVSTTGGQASGGFGGSGTGGSASGGGGGSSGGLGGTLNTLQGVVNTGANLVNVGNSLQSGWNALSSLF